MSWNEQRDQWTREIVALLYEHGMIRTFYRDKPEGWRLISGLYSPLYIQLRPLASYPDVFTTVCRAMVQLLHHEAPGITKTIGIAMAGVPIAAGMAIAGGIPAAFTRKMENVKTVEAVRQAISSYGEHALVEGEIVAGDRLVLVDDLVTRCDSKLIALEQVKHELNRRSIPDVECTTVAVLLDREQGAASSARAAGMELLSLIPFASKGLPLLQDHMHEAEWRVLAEYLTDPQKYQDTAVQEDLRRLSATVR